MTEHRPTGWNTWDFQGFNRFSYLRAGRPVITVGYAIWDETVPAAVPPPDPEHRKIGKLYQEFTWGDVTRLGPHAPLGLPAVLSFKAGDVAYEAEALDKDGTLQLTVTPDRETAQRIVFLLLTPAGEALDPSGANRGTYAGCEIKLKGATWPKDYFVNIAEPYAVASQPGSAASITVQPTGAKSTAAGTRKALEKEMVVGSGALADAPAAMMQAITWNTLFDSRRRLVSSPVSRDWCRDWRGVLVFCWDTYLVGTFMSYEAPELARYNFEAVNAAIEELGHVPNYYMAHGAASRDRSMPPLGSYMIWKTQCHQPDKAWLKRVYPLLTKWHGFWMKKRDGNGSGLLSWGSNDVPYEFPQLVPYNNKLQHTKQAAMYESGLDNSPMFDEAEFDADSGCLMLDDVALSSYYAMDCEALAQIALCLGKQADAAKYRREHEAVARRINDQLWDEEHGIYCNRHWDGRRSGRWSPTSFFPLIAGVAPLDRAQRAVREHLLNEAEFWGPYPLPSISRQDPAYADNDYWRGRIWGPFNFLVSEGLRRYRFDDAAAELARRSLDIFMTNWRKDGGVYENYNADTGEGADVWNAARLYHWGGLLAFMAMQELIDVEPAGYLRVGSLAFADGGLRNVRLGKHRYDVMLDDGVHVKRDGKRWLDCTTRAIVRLPLAGPRDEPIQVSAVGRGRLTLHAAAMPRRHVRLLDGTAVAPRGVGDKAVYVW
jgi:hypothetical protein